MLDNRDSDLMYSTTTLIYLLAYQMRSTCPTNQSDSLEMGIQGVPKKRSPTSNFDYSKMT